METSAQVGPGTRRVHVGRQPIFNQAGRVVAYELLFRGRWDAVDAQRRDTFATSQVIVNAFTEFGISGVAGELPCFINLTREFCVGELALPFGPDRAVLEILETVEVDDEVVDGVTRLAAAGYRIALDDFVWGLGHERLLDLADYVKIDFLACDPEEVGRLVHACRRRRGVQIVAEKLETDEDLALADRHGCELRQGYHLSRPQVLTAASLNPSRVRRLELLSALSSADTDVEKVLSAIANDPALSMRILRACNSAAAGVLTSVSSVRQAVVMLGLAQIRQWAMLMVLDDATGATDEQLTMTVAHARLCQYFAAAFDVPDDAAFIAGLISGVAVLLDQEPAVVAAQLPLSGDIATALVGGGGRLGALLDVVHAFERGEPTDDRVTDPVRMYFEALRWSTDMVRSTRA
jgi:EAL and modified HD-GYP domain-containing signal transduction protein